MKSKAIIALIILALITIACASSVDSPSPSTPAPPPPGPTAPPSALPAGAQPAEVVWVIDGDTIEVEIDGQEYRVRYIGIDTPERDMPYYEQATQANRQLVENQTILLVKDVSETDRFGRLLRYIYLPDGTFVNAQLVETGYAQAVTFPPDVAFADHFRQLQEEARQSGRGLWAE